MAEAITKNSTKRPRKWRPFSWYVGVHFRHEPTQISIYRISHHADDKKISGKMYCVFVDGWNEHQKLTRHWKSGSRLDWVFGILALYRAGHILAIIEVGKFWRAFMAEMKTQNSTKQRWSGGLLVELLIFNSVFGRHRSQFSIYLMMMWW